tara:strand:+ start:942 stop:1631 length:690 start_codon:yes stop_codon:yes gene_type:complete
MRVGAVILFKNGYCFQSYGWNLLRPLGNIQNVLDHLEEYNVDEISIIRPLKGNDKDDDFYFDLDLLSKIKSSTPLSFGGGLYNKNRIDFARSLSFERLIFTSNLFLKESKVIDYTKKMLGKQAVIGCLPLIISNKKLKVYNSTKNEFFPIEELNYNQLMMCDEFIVYDCCNEGYSNSFDMNLLDFKFFDNKKIIISGGVNKDLQIHSNKDIVSKLVENRVLHKEYSLKK